MTSWSTAPYVFRLAICCPFCGCLQRIITRSELFDDGVRCQKSVCERCSERYKVLLELPGEKETELPAFGNPEN